MYWWQWRSYRGFRRFNEPGPPNSWGAPEPGHKTINKKIMSILLKKKLKISLNKVRKCCSLAFAVKDCSTHETDAS